MTTIVRVSAPTDIRVEVQAVDPETMAIVRPVEFVDPGETRDFHCWSTQALVVREVRDEDKSE